MNQAHTLSHVPGQNLINVYQCETCRGEIVTVDRAPGVTPLMVTCRADALCMGRMFSKNYRVSQELVPTWEWYKPHHHELKTSSTGMREHVLAGGLLLREISQPPAQDHQPKRFAPMTFACKRGRR